MKLISFKKNFSRFLVTISKRCKSVDKGPGGTMKVFLQKRNPLTGSSEWDIGVDHDEYDYHQEIARSAFADMLHDTERNKMYYRALQLAIEKMHLEGKKANVLDIGTGTGLLSMMAVKCGADTVTACEAFKPMAECCLKILQQNGVADKIKVIPKRSTEITVGEGCDMDKKANILVTEVFDTELIGEGALPTFSHAHKYLLEKECIVVPDSAVIYAQVVECPFLQRWNKLDDVVTDVGVVLKTPQKMRSCAGSAAVHDLQLSQLPRSSFRELSDKIPVFRYDWSGKTPIEKNGVSKRDFTPVADGTAQAVFMWWDLNMDTDGKIVLSCAPWWRHPAADAAAEHPAGSVPWRDHWMQAVYYLPQEAALSTRQESTLVACHDEYSLWFEAAGARAPRRPVCECGVHVSWSRSHVGALNDARRGAALRGRLGALGAASVVLDLNGSSLLGLAAAARCRKLYVHETSRRNVRILRDYMAANDITNVEFLEDVREDALKEITNVIFDPLRSSSVLPWEDLQAAYLLRRWQERAGWTSPPVVPARFELWARPVELIDLQKVRTPVRTCEGFDVRVFDRLVERSRAVSDAPLEPQPLWEYPARSSGAARRLLAVELRRLRPTYALDRSFALSEWQGPGAEPEITVNAFAVWAEWDAGGGAPARPVALGERLQWDPHTKQAVKILRAPRTLPASARWRCELACDLDAGRFHVSVGLAGGHD